jgi:hypothetical protein
MYIKYPQMTAAVNTLEVTTSGETGVNIAPKNGEHGFVYDWLDGDQDFKEVCLGIIDGQRLSEAIKEDWRSALDTGSIHAFTGLLLVILPNLKSLLFGTARLRQLPIFWAILDNIPGFFHMPVGEDPVYSSEILRLIAHQIHELELPLEWPFLDDETMHHTDWRMSGTAYIKNMKPFRSLRTLIMHGDALRDSYFLEPSNTLVVFPAFGLQPLLEHVIIMDNEVGNRLLPLKEILINTEHLPVLQKISHYFSDPDAGSKKIRPIQHGPTYNELRSLAAGAGVAPGRLVPCRNLQVRGRPLATLAIHLDGTG